MSHNRTEDNAGSAQLDELFTELRLAMDAQREAGYQRAKYIWSVRERDDSAQASEDMLQATAKADELTASLWAKLYDVAPAFTDALTVLDAVKGLEVQA